MKNKPRSLATLTPIAFTLALSIPVAAAADDAAALFKSKCAMCHGQTGSGDTAMGKKLGIRPFASPEVQKQDDATLQQTIVNGKNKNKMPAFDKKLTPDQIKLLVAHIRSFAKR